MKLYDLKPKLCLEEISILGRLFDKLKSNIADIGENILIETKYYDGLFDFLVEFKNKLSQSEGDLSSDLKNTDIPDNLRKSFGFKEIINIESIEQIIENHKLLLESDSKHLRSIVEVVHYFLNTDFKNSKVKSPRELLSEKYHSVNMHRSDQSVTLLNGITIKFDKAGVSILDYTKGQDYINFTQKEVIYDIIDFKIHSKYDLMNFIDTIKRTIIYFSHINKEVLKNSEYVIDHLDKLANKQQSETNSKIKQELEHSLHEIEKSIYKLTEWHTQLNKLNIELIRKLIAYLKFCITYYH